MTNGLAAAKLNFVWDILTMRGSQAAPWAMPIPQAIRSAAPWCLVISLLATFVGGGWSFIQSNAQTWDESSRLVAGYSYIATGDFRLETDQPPLIKLICAFFVYLCYGLPFEPSNDLWNNADRLPLGVWFLYDSQIPADDILAVARVPTLVLGTCLIGLIGWWAYRLWGIGAALLAMALAAFDPNLVAHSCIIGTDLGVTFFMFFAVYLLWENSISPSLERLVGVGFVCGLALASKFSAVFLGGVLGVIAFGHVVFGCLMPVPLGKRKLPSYASRLLEASVALLLIGIVAIAVIPLVYFGDGYSLWWKGLREQIEHNRNGHPAFFLGDYSNDGWWSYFPVAFMIKTPPGTLLLLIGALAGARLGKPLGWRTAIFVLLPAVLFFGIAMSSHINIGLRHILPVYPFLFVIAGRTATMLPKRVVLTCLLLSIPVGVNVASVLRVTPHHLAYFNELVGGPDQGYLYLGNSNLDWGQDIKGVKRYLDREGLSRIYLSYFGKAPPDYYGIRFQRLPAAGWDNWPQSSLDQLQASKEREVVAISVTSLQGVRGKNGLFPLYQWLYRREPIAKIGYSIYVYDITGDWDAHLRIAQVYLKTGDELLAEVELRKVLVLDPGNVEAVSLLASLKAP